MENHIVKMINQPLIPHSFEIYDSDTYEKTANAIKTMIIRGAGAIGGAAGYGMAQGVLQARPDHFQEDIEKAANLLRNSRPTAQNLFYAVDKVLNSIKGLTQEQAKTKAIETAQAVADEDADFCHKLGAHGEHLITDGMKVMTHCNAGWLAFVDWGTALSPIFHAVRNNKKVFVYASETRPRCQGSRLTAWELVNENIPHKVIADNSSGHYLRNDNVGLIITGADRIAANGDTANKIGTYMKAVLAKELGIPFYIAAPSTTIDRNCPSGKHIPIEERHDEEVTHMFGWSDDGKFSRVKIAPKESKAGNPAFDVTPAKYIKGIITEKGIIPATEEGIKSLYQ